MDVLTVISTRRSIRQYQTTPVAEESLARILEAGRLAPSAANRQPWHFLVITDPAVRRQMRDAYSRDWFSDAPLILVVCADRRTAWVRADGEEFWKVDAAIALHTMILQATAEGLGTCWIGAFDEAKVKRILRIPDPIRVVAMTPIGYPGEEKGPVTNREALQSFFHRDTW